MTQLIWNAGTRQLSCRVCGHEGDADLLVEVTAGVLDQVEVRRCRSCRSVQIVDEPLDSSPDDASIDGYVESGAGLGTIAAALASVKPGDVTSFLDVGCNYGFALDLARFVYGWDVLGLEPSLAGHRGAAELDLEIRDGYLLEDTDLGRRFDLILASEVLEHVPDPLGFLRAIHRHLAPGGRLILTTPAAEVISRASSQSDVLAALSPGFHVFLASENGLVTLLKRAGFGAAAVTRSAISLHAVAAVNRRTPVRTEPRYPISTADLERYCATRGADAPKGSSLSTGMLVRLLRSLVARGDFVAAVPAGELAREAMRDRYGMDLSDPNRILADWSDTTTPPWPLMGFAFALGMIDLLHNADNERAASYFELTSRSADTWRHFLGISDLDSLDLQRQGRYHRGLALTRFAPVEAEKVAVDLFQHTDRTDEELGRVARLLVDIAAVTPLDPTGDLATSVMSFAPRLAEFGKGEPRVAALDALYMIGAAFGARGDNRDADYLLTLCEKLASSGRTDHGRSLAQLARGVRENVSESSVVRFDPPPVHYMIDTYWCDAWGTYLDGWVHTAETPISSLAVQAGAQTFDPQLTDRPDLLEYWPMLPTDRQYGFQVSIPGAPHAEIVLELTTADGPRRARVTLPGHPLPVAPPLGSIEEITELTRAEIASAPPGPILGIGLRSLSAVPDWILSLFGDREVVSLDIHPGTGVDLIGDAHQLSALFEPEQFAVVFTESLLEHLAAPWLFAAESARVLKPGGISIHFVPWVWPTHSHPNDFWRISHFGLEQLFSPELGFRVRQVRSFAGANVFPLPDWRESHVRMPTMPSGSMSWVSAERTEGGIQDINWPYDAAAGRRLAERYPLDGLAER
jgi:SAM-dependent methyltransferase